MQIVHFLFCIPELKLSEMHTIRQCLGQIRFQTEHLQSHISKQVYFHFRYHHKASRTLIFLYCSCDTSTPSAAPVVVTVCQPIVCVSAYCDTTSNVFCYVPRNDTFNAYFTKIAVFTTISLYFTSFSHSNQIYIELGKSVELYVRLPTFVTLPLTQTPKDRVLPAISNGFP